MSKKSSKTLDPNLSALLKSWEKVWSNLDDVNRYFQSYIDTTLLVHQRIKMEPLIKSFESMKNLCQKHYDVIDEFTAAAHQAKKLEVTLPWEGEKFLCEWDNWKDYLKEQHQIVLSSRSERKQLDLLVKITNNKEEEAYPVLDYAIANMYKMFFKLDEKKSKTNNKPKGVRKDGDFE